VTVGVSVDEAVSKNPGRLVDLLEDELSCEAREIKPFVLTTARELVTLGGLPRDGKGFRE